MKNIYAAIILSAATIGFANVSTAATPEAKATYKASQASADADYKVAHEKCTALTGNPKDVCVEEAKAARTRAKAEAKATYKNTPSARASARTAIANADYDVAKAKCGSQTGNAKDVCIKEAKAAKVAANANTTADKKVVEARVDARDEKRDANYKVAIEKCDAQTGAPKDACVASAKAQFGK